MSARPIRWKTLEGSGPAVDLARGLRKLIEGYLAAHPETKTVEEFARKLAQISPALLSGAVSGRGVPTPDAVAAIVRAATNNDADAIADWESKRSAAERSAVPNEQVLVGELDAQWRAWDHYDLTDPQYRDFNRLATEQQLVGYFGLARSGALADKPGDEWAFLVVSAVQHGYHYRHFAELADKSHSVPMAEALIEVMTMRDHRKPRWRAAWLLQRIGDEHLRAGVAKLGQTMPATQDPTKPWLPQMFDAIGTGKVEHLLDTVDDSRMTAEVREQLQAEFRAQFSVNAARGLLASFLTGQAVPPAPTTVAADMITRERLTSARDFFFVANRLRLTLAGKHPGDREESIESIFEGVTNRLADIMRLYGADSDVTTRARRVAETLDTWRSSLTDSKPHSDEFDAEIMEALEAFNTSCSPTLS